MKTNSIETVMVKSEVVLASGSQMAFSNVGLVPGSGKGWDVLSVHMYVDSDVSVTAQSAVGAVVRRTQTTPGSDIEDATTQDTVAIANVMSVAQGGAEAGVSIGGSMSILADNVVLNNLQFVLATINGELVVGDVTVIFVVELMPVDVPQSRLIGVLTEQP